MEYTIKLSPQEVEFLNNLLIGLKVDHMNPNVGETCLVIQAVVNKLQTAIHETQFPEKPRKTVNKNSKVE